MKTIIIFCRAIDQTKAPFDDPYYVEAYQDLLLLLQARGCKAYFATDNATYLGNGVFSEAYTTSEKRIQPTFRKVRHVMADLVYDKADFKGADVPVLNPSHIRTVANKIETYKQFGRYQPRSIICQSKKEVVRAFEQLQGQRIVVKEPHGYGGACVYIDDKSALIKRLPDRYPLLVQEFMDTSVGIEGLTPGMHDIRVEVAGGTIIGGLLRTPAPGELRANVSLGGTERYLLPEEIPSPAVQLAKEIDASFQGHPRHYAADFARTADGWKLIELNSKPGLTPIATSNQAKQIMSSLANYITAICP